MENRPSIEPATEEMRRLGYLAVDRIVAHLAGLGGQRVALRGTAAQFADLVDEELSASGTGLEDCIRFFFERVEPGMTRVNHPRFHAYVPCPGSFAGTVGEMLAAGTNPFVGSWLGGATLSSLELTVLRWIAEITGYPRDSAGILTSGGSMANLVGIAAARAKYGRDTLQNGRLYVSEEGHASLDKAAFILGYPEESVRRVPVDERLRMRVEELSHLVQEDAAAGRRPFLVCGNAGTTNTGAIDPLERIADVCASRDLWFHVDGAYGGFAALDPDTAPALAGMARADSLTLDPHKWLYAPMGVGCALVKETRSMESAFAAHGDYLQDLPADEVNFLDRGPELSRPARVLSVWAVLRSVGRDALAVQVAEDLRLARLAADLIAEDDRFEVVDPPQLSVVAFRLRSRDDETEESRAAREAALMEATLAEGTCMLSTTLVGGRNALRLVVMNHRTMEEDVRRSVDKVRELAS